MSADNKTLAAKLQGALRTKKEYLTVLASSEGLLKRIEEKEEWAWARSALRQGKLQQLKTACEDSVTEWGKELLVDEVASLKLKYPADVNLVEATTFKTKVDATIKELQGYSKCLLRMHTAAPNQ